MVSYGIDQALRVLALAPVLLALPGFLLLLPLAPRWGWLSRAVVGACITTSALGFLAWGLDARGYAFTTGHVRIEYGALLLAAGVAAALTRRQWSIPPIRLTAHVAALAGILALAAALAYRARWDYALPLHVDEWWGLDAARAIATQGTLSYTEPRLGLYPVLQDPEIGFHAFAAILHALTGADLLAVFHYGPVVMTCWLALSVYAACQREGYGLEAALMVSFLPTTVRLLGPHFFVPLALGLVFIPSAFLLFTSTEPRRTLPLVLLLVLFVFFAHPQSAAACGILISTYALLTMGRGPWKAAALVGIAVVPFVLSTFYFRKLVDPGALVDATSRLSVPEFLVDFGILPAALFLAGTFLTFLHPTSERLAWIVTSGAHLLLVSVFVVFGIGQANLYDRAWVHGMLTMSVTAAYALHRTRVWLASRVPLPRATPVVAAVLGLAVLFSALPGVAANERDYYRVVSTDEAADFAWIGAHAPADSTRVLIEPFKGTAFNALTGLHVYAAYPFNIGSFVYNATPAKGYNDALRAQRVLNAGVADDRFLDQFHVTLVYTHGGVASKNFTQVRPGVYERAS